LESASAERSRDALTRLAAKLNAVPRRCLGYRTPAEVFAAALSAI
jgi:IS30 family transposase